MSETQTLEDWLAGKNFDWTKLPIKELPYGRPGPIDPQLEKRLRQRWQLSANLTTASGRKET